jgi:hypothetical protein
MLGASENLAALIGEGLYINASISRLPEQIPALLRERRQAGLLGDVVVIHTGDNGYVIVEEFDLIMAELQGIPAVIWVNVRVPRDWQGPSNRVIAANVARYPNAALIDWYGASAGRSEYFREDGVHLTTEGRAVFAGLIAGEVKAARARAAEKAGCPPSAERGTRSSEQGRG